MDPITHGISGALIGKGFFSKRHARISIFAATLGAIFPDVDMFAVRPSRDPLSLARYHRGFTHSFLGLVVFAALLAWLTRVAVTWFADSHSSGDLDCPSFGALFVVYAAGIASHILLDATTSFGTRLWNPFSSDRVSWDYLFIIDFTFTALLLLPQIAAWIYKESRGRLARAASMWMLFTLLASGVWWLARAAGFSFSPRAVVLWSLVFAAIFFLPARKNRGVRFGRARWCQAGFYVACIYVALCSFARDSALARVRAFAAAQHLAVEKLGALPLPPSLLDWNGLIKTSDGVYQSNIPLFSSATPDFRLIADSPPNRFVEEASELEPVRAYFWFARFPITRFVRRGGDNIVEYADPRFLARGESQPVPFTFEVIFDSQGNVLHYGWTSRGLRFSRSGAASDSSDTPP